MLRSSRLVLALLPLVAALAACGGPSVGSAPPTRTQTDAPAPTGAPAATDAPTTPATAAPATAAVGSTTAAAGGVAQGRTAEGYQALGDPAAPVTMQFYSDFF